MKKGDLGMAKHYSKLRDELSTTCNLSIFYYLKSNSGLDTMIPIASPIPLYPASVVLFHLHGVMVSHAQKY